MSDILVDYARAGDFSAVRELARRRAAAGSLSERFGQELFTIDWTADEYRRILQESEHFYVAYMDGRVVGFLVADNGRWARSIDWLHSQLQEHCGQYLLVRQICVESSPVAHRIAEDLYMHVFEKAPFAQVVSGPAAETMTGFSAVVYRNLGFRPALSLRPPDGEPYIVWVRPRPAPGCWSTSSRSR